MSRLIAALCSVGVALITSAQTMAAGDTVRVDADGTVHRQEVTIPLSNLVSPEFRRFLSEEMATPSDLPAVPPPGAAKAKWDEFDRLQNRKNIERLGVAKQRYPVEVEETRIAGVRVAVVTPKGGVPAKNKDRVLINLRGSGFIVNRGLYFGQLESIPVASLGGFKVITLDYRQAPFHSYPAASQDVEAVYRNLLNTYKPDAIGIYGCSAGGLLAAQSIAWLAHKKLPRPGAVGVLCMSLSAPAEAKTQFYGGGDAGVFAAAASKPPAATLEGLLKIPPYMGPADTKDPKAWPGASDSVLAKFPPTLFLVGTREGFMSTASVDNARMIRLGVDSSLYVMEGAPHAAHITAVDSPEARDANTAIARFFDRHLAR